MDQPLLQVQDLKTHLFLKRGIVKAVDGISFDVYPGHSVGLVGESGSGKTMTAMSLLRLEPKPAAEIVGGSILFKGEDLVQKSNVQMQKIRGKEISIIMQDPMTSLNPGFTIGSQIAEAIQLHLPIKGKAKINEKVIEYLEKVMIPSPELRLQDYPHQLSGGMRQRVVGAMALCCSPSLLIADEPTTSLDVTIQAQYLQLLKQIQTETNVAMIFITHNLGIVAKMCDYVCVMYLGKIVERAQLLDLWQNPRHKYTQALLSLIPRVDQKVERLQTIKGAIHSPLEKPSGCSFHPRCDYADERCAEETPQEVSLENGHYVSCWKA
jgi:oligopeptide/dipeptide ABC transporter ATP-binding protein